MGKAAQRKLFARLNAETCKKLADKLIKNYRGIDPNAFDLNETAYGLASSVFRLAQPLFANQKTALHRYRALEMCTMSWNYALMSTLMRQEAFEQLNQREDLLQIFRDFIEFKLALFPDDTRIVMEFEYQEDNAGNFCFAVATRTPDRIVGLDSVVGKL